MPSVPSLTPLSHSHSNPGSPAPLLADPGPTQAPTFQPRFPCSGILTTVWFCHLLPCLVRLQTHLLFVILSPIMHLKSWLLSNGIYPISEHLRLPLYSRSSFQIQNLNLRSWQHQHQHPVMQPSPITSSGYIGFCVRSNTDQRLGPHYILPLADIL